MERNTLGFVHAQFKVVGAEIHASGITVISTTQKAPT